MGLVVRKNSLSSLIKIRTEKDISALILSDSTIEFERSWDKDGCYGKRGNRTDLSKEKWADVTAEQKCEWGNKKQTVKPVQNTAVTGKQSTIILNTKTALDCGHG